VTLLGHAIAVMTASEVVSSRGLIACARASVGDTRYALFILLELSGTTLYCGQVDYLAVY